MKFTNSKKPPSNLASQNVTDIIYDACKKFRSSDPRSTTEGFAGSPNLQVIHMFTEV